MGSAAASHETVFIEVWLDSDSRYKAVLSGSPEAKFLQTLSLAAGTSVLDGALIRLIDYGTDEETWGTLTVDREVTLQGVASVFGAQPVRILFGGIGGGGGWPWAEWPLTLWEVVNAGLTIAGIVSAAKGSRRWVESIRHSDKRAAAEAWRDSSDLDTIPLELRQHVRSRNIWYRQHFDDVFQIESSLGTRLLRSLGYEKTHRDGHVAWVEKNQ